MKKYWQSRRHIVARGTHVDVVALQITLTAILIAATLTLPESPLGHTGLKDDLMTDLNTLLTGHAPLTSHHSFDLSIQGHNVSYSEAHPIFSPTLSPIDLIWG